MTDWPNKHGAGWARRIEPAPVAGRDTRFVIRRESSFGTVPDDVQVKIRDDQDGAAYASIRSADARAAYSGWVVVSIDKDENLCTSEPGVSFGPTPKPRCVLCKRKGATSVHLHNDLGGPRAVLPYHAACFDRSTRLERVLAGLEPDPYQAPRKVHHPEVCACATTIKGATMAPGYKRPEPLHTQGDWADDNEGVDE